MNAGKRDFPAGRGAFTAGNKIRPESFRRRKEFLKRVVQIKYSCTECRRNK